MTTVLIAMAASVLIALVVLLLVAVPRVREGEKLFTPDSEDTVREASRRARSLAVQAAGKAADTAGKAVGTAGEVVADVRDRARRDDPGPDDTRSVETRPDDPRPDETRPGETGPDAWTPGPRMRPAARGRSDGTRTPSTTAVAEAPSLTGVLPDAALAEHVIDLRDPAPAPAPDPAPDPAPAAMSRTAAAVPSDAALGWGEPRPGPRHAR